MNQQSGKPMGFMNPRIYAQAIDSTGFRDVTEGNNGDFKATKGWDPCTGLGSPIGSQLLTALGGTHSIQAASERVPGLFLAARCIGF
jgi:kumamolisin